MNMSHVFKVLIPIDVRNVRRDNGISWMIFLPIFSAFFIRWGVPALTESLAASSGFDLVPYYPAILAYFFVIMAPITFSVMIGFVLLDEKDDNTLTALQVTPLSLNAYIAYRVAVPVVLTVLLVPILFPLSNISSLTWGAIILTAIASAPMSPMFALYLASIAQNKVQGFALMKLSGFILFIPIFAYFVESNWQLLFGIIPTYWPMKVYWLLENGQSPVWPYLLMALLTQSFVAWIFIKRFNRILHQ
jgi:fluoroquinolone transport system permease protein